MRLITTILILLTYSLVSIGQKNVSITKADDKVPKNEIFHDSLTLVAFLQKELRSDYAKGYLYANYVFVHPWSGKEPSVMYTRGNKVYLSSLSQGNADASMLRSIGLTERKIRKWKTPDPEEILNWENKMVFHYENNGYPFAVVSFSIDKLINDSVDASWNVNSGPMVLFDSTIQKGKYKPNSGFISTWLNIELGKPYDERKVLACRQRLQMSDLVEESQPMQVHFSNGKAALYFFLKKKKSNQFDGILGFSPNKENPTKIVFNGDVNLKLANSFNHGDVITLKWKSSANHSQEVNVKASVPYLFNLPVGINAYLDIYKRDTLYIKTKQHYGINFFSGIATEIEFFAENTDNQVIDQHIFEYATVLPAWADSRTTAGGLRIYYPSVDNIIIPHKGFLFEIETSAGKKKIIASSSAPKDLYKNVAMETLLWKGTAGVSLFRPLAGAFHIMCESQFGIIDAPTLFENDLYLLGGLRTLRGFDEKSIPVSTYAVSTIELRFFMEKFSYLALFSDYGAVRQMVNNQYYNKYYFSTGAGLSFSTNAGIFSIFYALGKSNPGKFSIRNGKLHFGFVARF